MVLLAIAVVVLLRTSENFDGRRIALALTAAPLLQFVTQPFMSGWGRYPWYFYFDFMVLGLAAALTVARLGRTGIRRPISVSACAIAVVIVAFPLSFTGGVHPNRDIAQVARRLQAS